jgi:hypothetical protein
MMNENIRRILSEISELEEELASVIDEQQERLHYRIEGSRIRFEENLRRIHHELKTGVLPWLRESELRNIVSAPFIYVMIVPFVMLDVFLFVYQSVCFPLYRIPKVKRSNYVVVDRHHLGYLNAIEKVNCMFCGYVDGLLSYTRQIVSRTEMYWCPIKHARKVLDPHRRYARFTDFGVGEDYEAHVTGMRKELSAEGRGKPSADEVVP